MYRVSELHTYIHTREASEEKKKDPGRVASRPSRRRGRFMKMWMDAHRDAFVRVTPPRVASRAHLHFSKRKIERSRTSIERRAMSTPSQTPLHPRIKWCEREDKVYLTIELPDARDVEVTIDAETFAFSAKDASGRAYAETLRLYKPVKKDESTYATTERQVFCAHSKPQVFRIFAKGRSDSTADFIVFIL